MTDHPTCRTCGDDQPTDPGGPLMPRRSLHRALVAAGFGLCQAGGNCTAYIRGGSSDGFEEVVTLDSDPSAPTRLSDSCRVWEGIPEDGDAGDGLLTTGAAIYAALTEPSDYALLSLRILNKAGA